MYYNVLYYNKTNNKEKTMKKETRQYYIWITDYADSNDIIVKTRDGNVKVETPKRVIPLDAASNDMFLAVEEANKTGIDNTALSKTAIRYVVKQYGLDSIDLDTSFWSISPHATQQEMVEKLQSDYKCKNTIAMGEETAH
jgi:hypothetical protein